MDRIRRDTLLGLVFFGTMAFLLWATVNLTDLSLTSSQLEVYFEDAGSVEVGTNVMVLGKKVGKVRTIDVDYDRADRPVKMTLALKEPVPLTGPYAIEVRDSGVLGGKQIYIDPRRGNRQLGGELLGDVKGSAFDRIGDLADGKGPVGENLNGLLAEFRKFAARLNEKESTIGQLTQSTALHQSILDASESLRKILDTIADGRGAVGRLIMDRTTGDNASQLLDNLRQASERLLATDGVLGVLLNDKPTAANVQTIVDNLATIVADAKDGKGVVGQLLRDPTLASDFASAVANLNQLLKKANDPDAGMVGAMTSDPVVGNDFKMTIANLRATTDALTRNEGLLGVLINDKDVAVRFRRILTQVSRAIEDAREAAPIGNFIQVLIGAF
jgi:ABC-type transporter Mla subunit MlaD